MGASACLRIMLHPTRLEKPGSESLSLAGRIANAFLETNWSYPRRAAQASPAAFVLTDPRASAIAPEPLHPLAAELQRHFFGSGDSGEATLALIEGPQAEISRCSVMPAPELRMLLNGDLGPLRTLLQANVWRMNARDVFALQTSYRSAAPEDLIDDDLHACFRGVFLAAKQEFIGSFASRWSARDPRHISVLDGPSHFPLSNAAQFDAETAQACVEAVKKNGALSGLLYLPVNYTNLSKPSQRTDYAAFLKALEALPKAQLVASLYDLPRDPFYSTIADVTAFLNERFGAVDLLIADPGFQLDSLSHAKARSINLCLPNTEDALRQSALKRFADNREGFRRKQLLPMVSNLRSAAELQACLNYKIPLVSGKAVTDILTRPLGMFPFVTDGLPLSGD